MTNALAHSERGLVLTDANSSFRGDFCIPLAKDGVRVVRGLREMQLLTRNL